MTLYAVCVKAKASLIIASVCLIPTVPEVTLESMFYVVNETDTTVSVCVELKSDLKRDVGLYLDVIGNTATGEGLICVR